MNRTRVEPLPYRHRYAAEMSDYPPGIVRRLFSVLKISKPPKATTIERNWYYQENEDDWFPCACEYLPRKSAPTPTETHRPSPSQLFSMLGSYLR